MTTFVVQIILFHLIFSQTHADDVPCQMSTKHVCVSTNLVSKIECPRPSRDFCSSQDQLWNLNDLSNLRLQWKELTFVNCAEKLYISSLICHLDTRSIDTVKFHHVRRKYSKRPVINAISLNNFRNVKNITTLEFVYYALEANVFDDAQHLKKLTIKFSEINFTKLLRRLPNLTRLDLSQNGIINIQNRMRFPGSYHYLTKYNSLDQYTFENLPQLKQLDLKRNSLSVIARHVYRHLIDVEEINFSNNYIMVIEPDAFSNNHNMKVLNLSGNQLMNHNSYVFMYPKSLEFLDMSNNNISHFYDEWMNPKIILNIDLRNNEINTIDLKPLQNALSLNLDLNFNETLDFYKIYNTNKNTRYLGGNPVVNDGKLRNLVEIYNHIRSKESLKDVFDLRNLQCLNSEQRYLCLLNNSSAQFCPSNCTCLLSPWELTFIVNCSDRFQNWIPHLSAPNFLKLEVHLESNSLTFGPNKNMGFDDVSKLYLAHNDIGNITWIPSKLEILKIDNNNIGSLDMKIIVELNESLLQQITLHDNPWTCECDSSNFIYALQTLIHNKQIGAENIKCRGTDALLINMSEADLCQTNLKVTLILSACLAVLGLFASAFAILCYKYEHGIKVYLFKKNMYTRKEANNNKKYDAFVCYTYKDETFLTAHLLPNLEDGPNPYKFCIHVRDWMGGELITNEIDRSIKESSRTIVIMSPNFLRSNWAMQELRVAHNKAMEGSTKVIIILYEDIDIREVADDDLRQYLKTYRFIKWPQSRFWDELTYALPHYVKDKQSK